MSVFLSDEVITSLLFRDSEGDDFRSLLISRCGSCLRSLEWPTPRIESWVSAVACPHCGRHYFTEGRRHGGPKLLLPSEATLLSDPTLAGLAMRLVQMERPAGSGLVRQIVGRDRQIEERRRHIRYRVDKRLVGAPLDAEGQPIERAVEVTLYDISASGMSLVVLGDWTAPYIVIDFGELGHPGAQFIGQVQWKQKYYATTRLGCRFLLDPDGALPLG